MTIIMSYTNSSRPLSKQRLALPALHKTSSKECRKGNVEENQGAEQGLCRKGTFWWVTGPAGDDLDTYSNQHPQEEIPFPAEDFGGF